MFSKNGSILLRKNDPPLMMYELFRYGREILCWRGLVSKFTETKPAHSPKRVDGSVTIQKLPTVEGVRKERKRKIESGIIDDETRLMVSLLNTISLEKRSPLICLKRLLNLRYFVVHQTVANTDALFENLNTEIRNIYHESSIKSNSWCNVLFLIR